MTSTAANPNARQPRGLVQINGQTMAGWISVDVDNNVFHDPDRASVRFAISGLPSVYGLSWWGQQTDLTIEVFAGFPPNPDQFSTTDLDSLFYGKVDEWCAVWETNTVEIAARDMSAPMIDTKVALKDRNQTASQVAQGLATKYGLTPVVTATTTKIGTFYDRDFVRLHSTRSEWDLLTWLAQREGFIAYLKRRELHFEPLPDPSTLTPYAVTYTPPTDAYASPQINATRLKTTRVLTVARDIQVTVKSAHAKAKASFSASASKGSGKDDVQQYSYVIPGLDKAQCQARANQILADLSRHEMRLEMSGPADNRLFIGDVIALSGTGTVFDQAYYPDNIRRSLIFNGGYSWSVSAKNHNTEAQVTL